MESLNIKLLDHLKLYPDQGYLFERHILGPPVLKKTKVVTILSEVTSPNFRDSCFPIPSHLYHHMLISYPQIYRMTGDHFLA